VANTKISALSAATTPVAGTEVLPIVQSSTTKQVSIANLTAGRAVSALSLTTTSDITLSGAATTNIYAYNPTAAPSSSFSNSPRVSFYGAEWNSSTGSVSMSGYWQLQALIYNTASPTSKLSLYLAGNGGTPAEIGYFGSNGSLVLAVAGGASTTVQNTTAATSSVAQPSGKRYFIGQSWNSASGNTTQTSYIYAVTDTNNANPTVEAIVIAPSNGAGGQLEGFKFLGNGNLVITTAAKGINFTANTAAAGMTSQLLNWYEEGTWTPNQGAGLTVVGAFSSSGTYTRIGRQVMVRGQVAGATSVAVNAAGVISSNLPFTAGVTHAGSMFNAAVNASGVIQITSASVVAATTMAATANITFTATYSV